MFGSAAVYVGAGLLDQVVYGVAPFEPVSLVLASAVLGATVLAAAHGPVRRTLGIDPARVLSGD